MQQNFGVVHKYLGRETEVTKTLCRKHLLLLSINCRLVLTPRGLNPSPALCSQLFHPFGAQIIEERAAAGDRICAQLSSGSVSPQSPWTDLTFYSPFPSIQADKEWKKNSTCPGWTSLPSPEEPICDTGPPAARLFRQMHSRKTGRAEPPDLLQSHPLPVHCSEHWASAQLGGQGTNVVSWNGPKKMNETHKAFHREVKASTPMLRLAKIHRDIRKTSRDVLL